MEIRPMKYANAGHGRIPIRPYRPGLHDLVGEGLPWQTPTFVQNRLDGNPNKIRNRRLASNDCQGIYGR